MPKPRILKNKKSDIEVSLIHLLEVILAIGVVLLLIYFAFKLSGLFFGRQDYDSAINNLEALSIRVKEIVKDKNDKASQTMVYTIPDDFILVGFSYDDNGRMGTHCINEEIVKSRPKKCQGKSCLCIYQNFDGLDFDRRESVTDLKCKDFNEKIVFLTSSTSYSQNFMGSNAQWKPNYDPLIPQYIYLVIYGQCTSGPIWGARQISINKHKEGENIFIIIDEKRNK